MTGEPEPKRDWLEMLLLILVVVIILVHPTSKAFSLAWLGRLLGFSEKIVEKAPRLTLADILIWLAGALLFLRILLRREFRLLRGVRPAAVLLVALTIASMLFAQNKLSAIADVIQYLEYFIVCYLVLVIVLGTRGRLEKFTWLWLALGLYVVLAGLVHYVKTGRAAVDVSSTFLNRNILSGYLAMTLPFAWGMILHYDYLSARLAWLVLIAVGLVVVLAGGPWIAAVIGILVVSVIRSRKLLPVVLLALLILVVGAFPLLPRNNTAVLAKSIYPFHEELKTENPLDRVNPRYIEWQAAAKFLTPGYHRELGISRATHLRQLLLGVGIGNYQLNVGRFYGYLPNPNENTVEPDTHNVYLVLAVSVGIPAMLAFLWLVGSFLRRAALGYARTDDPFLRGLLLGCTGALTSILITNIFTSTLIHGTGPAMILVFAFAAAGARLAERKSIAAE
ncbi:MAG: hypothetical protein AMK75_03330 [Planctomycetes bacterium SM23_65]|nr:MAG: hypothetical protein AMK75_03330 [Planctomycetes bacterium SM23_65]